MSGLLLLAIAVVVLGALAYVGAAGVLWSLALAVLGIAGLWWIGGALASTLGVIALVLAALAGPKPLRKALFTGPMFAWYRKVLPQVSQTEQEALDAGTVWWDADLFTGKPDWRKLLAIPKPKLSAEEQAFLNGPVEELCGMLDDWKIHQEYQDLPPHVWQYIKDHGFMGMIIPKRYGGLEFSALAHSEVVVKLSTRSNAAAVSVMVPNSLGPAELLLHYGTEEQKNYYLPRLARGLEVPCFALTSPEAGSDAASIPDYGIVCRADWQGKKDVLGMHLTWDKRYITLGPVATLLGLAFKLHDPQRLLGGDEDLGITLALIPTNTPGVNIGRRHLPLNGVFQNGPNSGKDVFIPLDYIIGGRERVGQGWRMLMNCLAAGRSISLPAQSAAGAKLAARATGAYARVRQQFNTPIGRFEGVEEALARIGGNTYLMDAARVMTAGAVDLGEKPAVISAIAKYHLTERLRTVITDAMDVHGGKGICLGPNNYLGRAYQLAPVAITVEGANILTRSMIIFGQGAIRCHPYVLKEIEAANDSDAARALDKFDGALGGHIGFIVSNAVRALVLGLSGARFAPSAGAAPLRRYYQRLTRYASAFAFLADVSMLVLGGSLKRREKISARLGDILSYLYLASTVLKRYEDEGQQQADLPLARWALDDSLYRMQHAFLGVMENFPNRVIARALRWIIFPLGARLREPTDELGHQVASLLLSPSATRDRLTPGVYVPRNENDIVGRLEFALEAAIAAEPIGAKLRRWVKDSRSVAATYDELVNKALEAGVLNDAEIETLRRARQLTRDVIKVDDFPADFGRSAKEQTPAVRSLAAA